MLARLTAACLLIASAAGLLTANWHARARAAVAALEAAERADNKIDRAAALSVARRHLEGGLATGALNVAAGRLALAESPPDYERAEQRLTAALSHSPARAAVWALLAEARAVRAGRADDAALDALQSSFLVGTFATPEVRRQRLAFVVKHWDDLERSLQRAGMRQVAALAADREDERWVRRLLADAPPGGARDALERALARADLPPA